MSAPMAAFADAVEKVAADKLWNKIAQHSNRCDWIFA